MCDESGMRLFNNSDSLMFETKKMFDKDNLSILQEMFKSIGVIIDVKEATDVE